MKKILIALLTIVLTLGLTACGDPSPTDVTTSFLDAVKAQDAETVKSVYSDKVYDFVSDSLGEDQMLSDDATEQDKEFLEKLTKKMLDFDYEIVNEEIKGDKATVEVKFTTYDMGQVLKDTMNDYMNQALVLAFSDASEEQLTKLMYDIIETNMDKAKEKDLENTATINLSKTDNGWKINTIAGDSDFTNAISGGMIKAMSSLEDTYDFEE